MASAGTTGSITGVGPIAGTRGKAKTALNTARAGKGTSGRETTVETGSSTGKGNNGISQGGTATSRTTALGNNGIRGTVPMAVIDHIAREGTSAPRAGSIGTTEEIQGLVIFASAKS